MKFIVSESIKKGENDFRSKKLAEADTRQEASDLARKFEAEGRKVSIRFGSRRVPFLSGTQVA